MKIIEVFTVAEIQVNFWDFQKILGYFSNSIGKIYENSQKNSLESQSEALKKNLARKIRNTRQHGINRRYGTQHSLYRGNVKS